MKNTNEIKSFLLKAVSQREHLIKSGKSRISKQNMRHTLIFLKSYAQEIKDRKRLAKFYQTHYTKILDIAPPTWSKKAQELYNECQLILNY